MVVIFVKLATGKNHGMDISLQQNVLDLKTLLNAQFGYGIKQQKILFSGRVLGDEESLADCSITKECSVQLFLSKPWNEDQKSEKEETKPSNIGGEWQVVPEELDSEGNNGSKMLDFGEMVLVQLLSAVVHRAKKKKIPLKPYAVLVVGSNSARSSSIQGRELFGFLLGQCTILRILLFNHDMYTMDSLIGRRDVNLNNLLLATNTDVEVAFGTFTLKLRLRKCTLVSPSHSKILTALMSTERSWTLNDLSHFGVTLRQLTGEEAWVNSKNRNPVIDYLIGAVVSKNMTWTPASLKRIESILMNQSYLHTPGEPTTQLWFSGLRFSSSDSGISPQVFLAGIQQYDISPKHVYIGKTRPVSFAMVEFKTIRDSIVIFSMFQHKTLGSNKCIVGFGQKQRLTEEQLLHISMAGFLNIHLEDDQGGSWTCFWCFLIKSKIHVHKSPQYVEEEFSIDVCDCAVIRAERNLLEVHLHTEGRSFFIHCINKSEVEQWCSALKFAALGQQTPIGESSRYKIDCLRCSTKVCLENSYVLDTSTNFSCINCLRKDVLTYIDNESIQALSSDFSIRDLRDLLGDDEFNHYLDVAVTTLVATDEHYVTCPDCGSTWEFQEGGIEDAPNFESVIGIDNRSLTSKSQCHFLSHRVCCRECGTSFCRSCREIGYHAGFDCVDYAMYKNARHCRYCSIALMPDTIGKNPPSISLEDICNNSLCLQKRDRACLHMLPCGHPCPGIRNDQRCMPCLYPNCEAYLKEMHQTCNDFCNICFTENLGANPCIQLDCGHIFHHRCINRKLEEKWSSPRIEFGFINCPLCKIRISHPMIDLSEMQTLHRELEKQTYDLMIEEQLLNEDELQDAHNEYYQNPCGFGLYKKLAFYTCHQCKKPYYGGMAQCLDGLEEVKETDFICSACSGIGAESCVKHGKDFVVYKCKFCCSVSQFKVRHISVKNAMIDKKITII